MNTRILRIGAAASSLVAVGLLLAPASLAADCTISGNGSWSHNRCNITVNRDGHRHHRGGGASQSNSAHVSNSVLVISNTGGNDANNNTGGNVTTDTGNSNVTVTIRNNGNSNVINP